MIAARVVSAEEVTVSETPYTREQERHVRGVYGLLLPLVILTELGGGLLVLFGLKTRWAAIALSGYCLLTALLFHLSADQTIHFNKNVAMAGGFLTQAICGPGQGR